MTFWENHSLESELDKAANELLLALDFGNVAVLVLMSLEFVISYWIRQTHSFPGLISSDISSVLV